MNRSKSVRADDIECDFVAFFLYLFLLEFFYSFRQNYSQTLAVLWKMQLKQPVCSIKFDFSPLFSSFEKPSYSTPLQILREKRGDRARPSRSIRKGGIGEDRIPARPGQLNPICLRSRKFKRAEIPPPPPPASLSKRNPSGSSPSGKEGVQKSFSQHRFPKGIRF